MISNQQREALALLAQIWELSPDVRLGQLFAHLGFLGEVHFDRGLGYIDDDEMLGVLYRHRTELQARLEGSQNQTPPPPGSAPPVSQGVRVAEATPAAEL